MRVCLVCIEMFGRGTYGGFGRATRIIGRELIARNIDVYAVVPQRGPRCEQEYEIEGMKVLEYSPKSWWSSLDLYRSANADVYHSQDASLSSYLAMKAMPERAHVITFRDPMSWVDWRVEWRYAKWQPFGWIQYFAYVDNFLVRRAVRHAAGLYCAANFLITKVKAKYGLRDSPRFLPTPVDVPHQIVKSKTPLVCHVGRWHRRKRPEVFLELAKNFPDVRFVAVGGTREQERDIRLRRTYAGIPNLEMTGIIDQFETDRLDRILRKSWILINTSTREGLPNTFLEATAHKCAILSMVDPDGFASRFGHHAQDGDLRKGLAYLLEKDRWKHRGKVGYDYVRSVFATNRAMDGHIEAYREALSRYPLQGPSIRRTP
jgi:glycosyltransferase involved in cell wall biosynthesis